MVHSAGTDLELSEGGRERDVKVILDRRGHYEHEQRSY